MLHDHLPGDLWILWMVAHLYHLFSPPMRVEDLPFLLLLKLVPAIADLGIGAVLFLLVRDRRGARAGLFAAMLFMFNPASIFLTAIWGQWDSVSMVAALLAVWLMLRSRLEWAFPLLTYAALIKPPLALLAVLPAVTLGLEYVRPSAERRWRARKGAWRVVVAVVASATVFCVVLLPFNVGLAPLPTRWNLMSRLSYAWNYRLWTTGSAFNLWNTPLDGKLQPDTQQFWLGLSYNAWGTGLMLVALGLIVVLYCRRSEPDMLLWACLALTFAAFLLPTRGHERYLFPAVVFAAALAAMSPGLCPAHAHLPGQPLLHLRLVLPRAPARLSLSPRPVQVDCIAGQCWVVWGCAASRGPRCLQNNRSAVAAVE